MKLNDYIKSAQSFNALANTLHDQLTLGQLRGLISSVVTHPDLAASLDRAIGKKADQPIKRHQAEALAASMLGYKDANTARGSLPQTEQATGPDPICLDPIRKQSLFQFRIEDEDRLYYVSMPPLSSGVNNKTLMDIIAHFDTLCDDLDIMMTPIKSFREVSPEARTGNSPSTVIDPDCPNPSGLISFTNDPQPADNRAVDFKAGEYPRIGRAIDFPESVTLAQLNEQLNITALKKLARDIKSESDDACSVRFHNASAICDLSNMFDILAEKGNFPASAYDEAVSKMRQIMSPQQCDQGKYGSGIWYMMPRGQKESDQVLVRYIPDYGHLSFEWKFELGPSFNGYDFNKRIFNGFILHYEEMVRIVRETNG